MKRRAHSIALRLVGVATQKALLVSAVAALAIVAACAGVWGHSVYAAKVRAEQQVQKQAATLNDVMAKLNRIESEVQQQTSLLSAKLDAVEHQNAKLAMYEVSAQRDAARVELAAARMPIGPVVPGAYPQISPSLMVPLELESKVCGHGGLSVGGKLGVDAGLDAGAEGDLGAEIFGDGIDAKLGGKIGASAGLDVGADGGLDTETCLTLAQFNIFGSTPTVDEQQFVNAITSGGKTLADGLVRVYNSFPQLAHAAEASGLDALANTSQSFSPQQILQNLENPKQAFQNFSNLVGTIPLPQGISNIFQDPSSLFPQPTDLNNPQTLCSSVPPSGGLFSTACGLIPGAVANLSGINTSIGQFANVQGDLTKFQGSLSTFCSTVNTGISQIDGASIPLPTGINFFAPTFSTVQVPIPFGSITVVDGVSQQPPTLSTTNINLFNLKPIPCS